MSQQRADFLAATFQRLLAVRPPLSQDQIESAMNEARNWSYQSAALNEALGSAKAQADMERVKAAWSKAFLERQQADARRQEQLQAGMQNQQPWFIPQPPPPPPLLDKLIRDTQWIEAERQADRQAILLARLEAERFQKAVAYVKRKLSSDLYGFKTPDGDLKHLTIYGHPADPVIAEVIERMVAERAAALQRRETPPPPKSQTTPNGKSAERGSDPAWSGQVRSRFWAVVDWMQFGFAGVGAWALARWLLA